MEIKIHILTPIHIGSGREIQSGYEYAYFPNERKVAVLDPEKILALIGEDQIDTWISCIEKGENLMERLPQLHYRESGDVGQRSIIVHGKCNKPIREQLRSGGNCPMLPGSSLKGSLRTAVFGETVVGTPKLAQEKRNLGLVDYRGGFRWSDASLQKMLFGKDPNHDIFRLLQVGDAHFQTTEVVQTQIVNLKGKEWKVDRGEGKGISPEAWIEAIPAGATASAEIRFNTMLKTQADQFGIFNANASKLQLPNLFRLVNHFTKRLVSDELKYWTEKADVPAGFDEYIPELERIVDSIEQCAENACVLRLGWGSGFRSMTGDWHGVMTDDDYDALISTLRSRKYEGLMFPKTTRFAGEGIPLGFLKLAIVT